MSPVQSQTSDTPSERKRRRQSSALSDHNDAPPAKAITCIPCRSRKIKCDSAKPTCANCAKILQPEACVYPVKQRPGFRAGMSADIMSRLEALEARLGEHERRLSNHDEGIAFIRNGPPSTASDALFNWTNPVPQQQAIPLPVSAIQSSAVQYPSPSARSTLSYREPQMLPPDDLVQDLIRLFFEYIHPWAPILSPLTSNFSPPWSIIVYAIIVVTLRFSDDPRLHGLKPQYHQAAKDYVLVHAIQSTSIISVQALAIVAIDLIGSDQSPKAWGTLGLLSRSAVHLGLIKEEDAAVLKPVYVMGKAPVHALSRMSIISPPMSWQEDESRRRLLWLIFSLDRYACASTGWDFALPSHDIKRRLPSSDVLWAGSEWQTAPFFQSALHDDVPHSDRLSPMAYLVQALDILGRSHVMQLEILAAGDDRALENRKNMTLTLTASAKRWFNTVPVRDVPQNALTLMIQGVHYATLLKLNAYHAFPASGETQEPFKTTCLDTVQSVLVLIRLASVFGWKGMSTPMFIFCCWIAARNLFVYAFLTGQSGPSSDYDEIVDSLREQAAIWPLAEQYVKALDRAKTRWLGLAFNDTSSHVPAAINVLLDLRQPVYSALQTEDTPLHTPPELDMAHLPAWALQPLLGDLHDWFDLPAGIFSDT